MSWKVEIEGPVKGDLQWIGRKRGKEVIEKAIQRLSENPLEESRNMKTLRPNAFAQRALRVGKYRILFNVDPVERIATIRLAGEKQGERLIVRGEEFAKHHEDHPTD